MKKALTNNIKNTMPFIGFSIITGFISALLITAFKIAAEVVIHFSQSVYGAVREDPVWIPLLVAGAALIGLSVSFILSASRSCKGGGIPTSVAAIRGIVSFKWAAGIFVLPFSALLTFLCGIPLGTEGPCVQMGTAIGEGVIKCFGSEKHVGWRRYIMTGGASAGFSIATCAPVSAIVFSMEELHKHFSPLLLTGASVSVLTAQITVQILEFFGIDSGSLFHLPSLSSLSLKALFAPLLVGIACGICSIFFTRLYHLIDKASRAVLNRISEKVMFPLLFACTAVVGFFFSDTLGTGHSLVDKLFETNTLWYLLIFAFLIRAFFMMTSNTSGVTGGTFLPTLAFGAIVGALCAKGMIALGWLESDHYILTVVLGITAFLGATSRIPITASVFAIEALAGINNVLPIIIAVTVSFIVVELSGVEDFTDTLIEAKLRSITKGKYPTVVVTSLTVKEGSLAVGKELRDVLWPSSCTVVSYEHASEDHDCAGIRPGDVITVRYKTYASEETTEELKALVGAQNKQ